LVSEIIVLIIRLIIG